MAPYNFNSGHGKFTLASELRNLNSSVLLGPPEIIFALMKCSVVSIILGSVMKSLKLLSSKAFWQNLVIMEVKLIEPARVGN